MSQEQIVSIKILDRHYKIKCPSEEASNLQASARYVDTQMRKLKQSGSVTQTDRIAVVTALNICNELMSLKKQRSDNVHSLNRQIEQMQNRIESALSFEEEIPI